jgi:hypothetical protein
MMTILLVLLPAPALAVEDNKKSIWNLVGEGVKSLGKLSMGGSFSTPKVPTASTPIAFNRATSAKPATLTDNGKGQLRCIATKSDGGTPSSNC